MGTESGGLGQLNQPVMLGAYRLLEKVGEGGMGAVYLAVRADQQFEKKVAIKVAPSALQHEEVLIRFRLERQTLAKLDHPNIIKLLDGGASPSGVPYLVMDHVDGLTLNRYCDQNALSIRDRLLLFRKICSAVHYAHQHLIVHRDIKPANILVTEDGEPKLLDFGIAKLLDEESSRFQITSEGVIPMTLRYASPEQISGKPVTVSSDLYSLGVLLYELLTAETTHYQTGVAVEALMWRIVQEDPRPPSAACKDTRTARALEGDLDAILLKALRKESADRYQSVEHFSEDLRRHLESQPVLALQGTWRYRARKFINRHQFAAVLGALLTTALLAALAGMVYQWNVARMERARADTRFQDVHQLARSFLFEFEEALEKIPGSTEARVLLLQRTSEYLERLARDTSDDEAVLLDIGEAYIKMGAVQASSFTSSLGDLHAAEQSYRKANEIEQRILKKKPFHRQALDISARALLELSDTLGSMGKMREAVAQARQAADIFAQIAERDPSDARALRDAGVAFLYLAGAAGSPNRINLGDRSAAIQFVREAIKEYENAGKVDSRNQAIRANVSLAKLMLGELLAAAGAATQARTVASELEGFAAQIRTDSSPRGREGLADFNDGLGRIWQILVDHPKARAHFEESENIRRQIATLDGANTTAQFALADLLYHRGLSRAALGDAGPAKSDFRDSLGIWRDLVKRDPHNLLWQGGLVEILAVTGAEGEATRIAKEFAERPEATPDEVVRYARLLRPRDPQAAAAAVKVAAEMTGHNAWEIEDELAQDRAAIGDWQGATEAAGRALGRLEDASFPPRKAIEERSLSYRQKASGGQGRPVGR